MKKLIEDGCIILHDKNTMSELSAFIEKNNKFYGDNTTDDLVSALYWASYIINMGILDDDYQLKKKNEDDEEDAWGIIKGEDGIIQEDWSWL